MGPSAETEIVFPTSNPGSFPSIGASLSRFDATVGHDAPAGCLDDTSRACGSLARHAAAAGRLEPLVLQAILR